jgi:hypothetical protein
MDETQLMMISYDLYRKIYKSIAHCDYWEYSLLKQFLLNLLIKANLHEGDNTRSYTYVNNWHSLKRLKKSVCIISDSRLFSLCIDIIDISRNNPYILQNLKEFLYGF